MLDAMCLVSSQMTGGSMEYIPDTALTAVQVIGDETHRVQGRNSIVSEEIEIVSGCQAHATQIFDPLRNWSWSVGPYTQMCSRLKGIRHAYWQFLTYISRYQGRG